MEHMEELGLLNDEDYARRLANELFTRKKFGARRVKQELRQKGIDDALIAAVTGTKFPQNVRKQRKTSAPFWSENIPWRAKTKKCAAVP